MSVSHITEDNFEQVVKQSDIPVLIDFWAPWCAPCKMMGPVFEELSKEYEGKLKFCKVNTDENPSLSQTYSISGIPCLVLTNSGEEKDRIVGFSSKDQLKEKIDSIMG
jgi:thioredoxin 1